LETASGKLFGDLDHDLRLALLFGIAGIIVTLLGALLYGAPPLGEILYVIGVILIIIGLVYLIKYLVENG
jgi:putative Mn2+ efflux pump MntP